jgi:hypothetical protein
VAIRDLQSTLAELGRIRLGQRVPARSGRGLRPDKLDRFKFTSGAEHLITEIAALYGGTVEPFTGEGVRGKQFQVVTDTNIIPVYLPRQKIDPFYESWQGGVCTRRCDGERDHIHDNPCDCNPEKRACKPTTRVSVMLADVPGIGVWRLETHGIYAAMEMSQLAVLLSGVPIPVPGRLLLESRARKFFNRDEGKVETRDYYVPVVIIDSVTSRQVAMGGDALTQAVRMGTEGAAAIAAAERAPAIEAGPARPAGPDPAVIARGLEYIAGCTPEQMADARERIRKMGDPRELIDAFQVRLGEHKIAEGARMAAIRAERQRAAQDEPPALTPEMRDELEQAWQDDDVEPPADEPEPAPAVHPGEGASQEPAAAPPTTDRGNVSDAMMAVLTVAAKLRMGTGAVDALIQDRYQVTRHEVNETQLLDLAEELRRRVAAKGANA